MGCIHYLNAVELAKEIGYANYWGEPRNPFGIKHYPRLYKEHVPADLEIHHIPVRHEYSTLFNSELIFRQKKAVIGFQGCFVPCDSHKVIQNFIHSQLSNSGHRLGIVSLRDINDIYRFSNRTDLIDLLPLIQNRKEAESYFTIAQKLLGLPISIRASLSTTFFCWKHDMNLKSRLFFSLCRLPWVLSGMFIHAYPEQIKEAFIYKDARQSLLRRLGSRQWYIQHFRLVRKNIAG